MRYDDLEIKDVIDRCVEGILQEDDKEFLSHTNWESEWIFLLARKIYEALSPDPSFSHQSLEAAARFLDQTYAEDNLVVYTFPSWKELIVYLPLTSWNVYLLDAPRGRRFSISLNDSHLVYCGSSIPTGFLLTIDCHFPYIREKAKELMWEYERRGLIREISTIAKEYGMI
jgi:hypothetical protein